jgi:uncharacterized protein (TIGR03067 family)
MTPTLVPTVLLLAAGAPALKDKSPAPALIGQWSPETVTAGSRTVPTEADRWEFRRDGTWSMYNQGAEISTGTFAPDPQQSPAAMDLTDGLRRRTYLCRYRVDSDTLVLCIGNATDDRPGDTDAGPRSTVWVFRRVEDK